MTGFINPVMTGFSIFAKGFGLNPSVLDFSIFETERHAFLKFDSILVFKEISAVYLA